VEWVVKCGGMGGKCVESVVEWVVSVRKVWWNGW
jgi:hypothetical protein